MAASLPFIRSLSDSQETENHLRHAASSTGRDEWPEGFTFSKLYSLFSLYSPIRKPSVQYSSEQKQNIGTMNPLMKLWMDIVFNLV